MENFGSYLKTHREKKGIRLEEIASITKIHVHSLELLEAGKWDQLPPEPFIRGFIVAYSKYVGLSQNEVMERFREATGSVAPPPTEATEDLVAVPKPLPPGAVAPPPQELSTPFRLPSAPRLITAASFVAVVAIALVLINVGRDDAPATEATATATATTSPTEPLVLAGGPTTVTENVAASAPVNTPAPTPVAEDKKVALASTTPTPHSSPSAHEVVVQGKARTWIKVVIDEAAPVEYFLAEGKSVTYQAEKKIKVVLGNSAGAVITHNGQVDEGKQLMGTIKTYKFPDNARFPQDVPAKPLEASAEKS
ncbi:DUF4115 domain-containing protein [bacterium]|nr:DUF4115 domain-containing protein [bacterium]